jgi:DNA-binding response OmpR family regulator
MKCLIVDDNKEISELLTKFLTLTGYHCDVSHNGNEGVAQIMANNYDFILLDLAMPETSGFDLIESLAKNGKLETQKIIVVTASSITDEELEPLIKKGMRYLRKPVDLDRLLDVIISCTDEITQQTNKNLH